MPRHGVGVGENGDGLQHSSVSEPECVSGSGRTNYAGLGFDLIFLVADAREAVAVDFEENQYFLGVVPVDDFIYGEPLVGPPTDAEQCKKGGWSVFEFPRAFKNQGDCVRFVKTGK